MVTIIWADYYSTGQIYSSGIELALCSDDNKQIGPFVFCKDFFQDAILAEIHGISCNIYGYNYDPNTMPPICKENLKVLIAWAKSTTFRDRINSITDFLHQIEKEMKLSLTTIEECENTPKKYSNGIWLLTADKAWMHAPPLLSMWTLLARNGLCHRIGDNWKTTVDNIICGKTRAAHKNDKVYLEFGFPGIELVIEKGIDLFLPKKEDNYPINKSGNAMHHFSGIVAYGSCKAKSNFPKWYYPNKETNPPECCFH